MFSRDERLDWACPHELGAWEVSPGASGEEHGFQSHFAWLCSPQPAPHPHPHPHKWEALDSSLGSPCALASLSLRCGYDYISHRLLCGLSESMHHNYHGPH